MMNNRILIYKNSTSDILTGMMAKMHNEMSRFYSVCFPDNCVAKDMID